MALLPQKFFLQMENSIASRGTKSTHFKIMFL